MKAIILASAFALVTTAAAAQSISGGSAGGLGFECDVNAMSCSCKGVEGGADCKAMAKNCKNPVTLACDNGMCVCRMASRAAPRPKPPVLRPPKNSAN